MRSNVLICGVLALLCVLSTPARGAACDPSGTWYGGSAWKYLATITPNADGTYTLVFQAGYDSTAFGYTAWTNFSGQVARRGDRNFEVRGLALYVLPPSSDPNTPPKVEMDVLHSLIRLKDGCDTLVHTIDLYGGYVPFTEATVPFVTPMDLDFLSSGGPIVETYHRMRAPK